MQLVEAYPNGFGLILYDSEEPPAFFIFDSIGMTYHWSIATQSGSARHHSHKRTIVSFENQTWRCRACSKNTYVSCHKEFALRENSNCRHISIAKEAASAQQLSMVLSEDKNAVPYDPGSITQQAISYLPIAPLNWCRFATDSPNLRQIPFRAGRNLPSTFSLDQLSRCSCGVTMDNSPLLSVSETDLIIFTSYTAILTKIETMYCSSCSNTKGRIGPDMGKHGVFNWNNRLAFSHELFDEFTSQFTTSETPVYAYHQTIMNTYMSEESPTQLCSFHTFILAYFAYVRLQQIHTGMECLQCGPNPPVVIADGISVSFLKHRIDSLMPPTLSDKSKALIRIPHNSTKATCFIGPYKLRYKIGKVLNEESVQTGRVMLKSILEAQVNIRICYIHVVCCVPMVTTVNQCQLMVN